MAALAHLPVAFDVVASRAWRGWGGERQSVLLIRLTLGGRLPVRGLQARGYPSREVRPLARSFGAAYTA